MDTKALVNLKASILLSREVILRMLDKSITMDLKVVCLKKKSSVGQKKWLSPCVDSILDAIIQL